MITMFTLADFTVGDNVQAFHPAMFGVIVYGRVVTVGRKWLHIDFGPIHGGTYKVHPENVTQNWGEG
jgi:hypothetical protein